MLSSISSINKNQASFKASGYYTPAIPKGKLGHFCAMEISSLEKPYLNNYLDELKLTIKEGHFSYSSKKRGIKGYSEVDKFTCGTDTITIAQKPKKGTVIPAVITITHGRGTNTVGTTEIFKDSQDDTEFDAIAGEFEKLKIEQTTY